MSVSRVAVLQTAAFASMLLAHVAAASGTSISRETLAPVSGSSAGRLQLIAVRGGSLQGNQPSSDVRHSVEIDQAMLVLQPEFKLHSQHGCELLVIDAPIELAQQVIGQDTAHWGALLDSGSLLLQPTVAFASQLLRGDRVVEASNLSAYYVERLLQEMLLGLIVDGLIDRRQHAAPTAPDLYQIALAVIQARSSDAGLTTDLLAEEVHLSRRQLERLFHKHGTSVASEVRRTRVAQAVLMLQDPKYRALSIDQIGQFVGLSGGSSLARTMAAEGFDPPSVVRKNLVDAA